MVAGAGPVRAVAGAAIVALGADLAQTMSVTTNRHTLLCLRGDARHMVVEWLDDLEKIANL